MRPTSLHIALAIVLVCYVPGRAIADGPAVAFKDAISMSEVVFRGTMIGSTTVLGYNEMMLFRVDRVWKGSVSRYTVVLTEGHSFAKGKDYLVCASSDGFPWIPYTAAWSSVRNATEQEVESLGAGTAASGGSAAPLCLLIALSIVAGAFWRIRRRARGSRRTI